MFKTGITFDNYLKFHQLIPYKNNKTSNKTLLPKGVSVELGITIKHPPTIPEEPFF